MPALLLGLLPILSEVLDKVLPDPEARNKALAEIMAGAERADLAQIDVNRAEAATSNMFIAGWRPFIGWIGGVAIGWQFVAKPMITTFGYMFGEQFITAVLNAPSMDQNMWELVTAMLGIGAMRSYEKMKGVAK